MTANPTVGLPLWFPLALLLALGCGSGEGPGAGPPSFEGSVDLRIGEIAGEDAYLFGRIGGVVRDSVGRAFVVDAQADEVRVFDRDGRFLFRVGRRGEGPGELKTPCCPAIGPEGRLWVRESGNARYSAFALGEGEASFETSVRMGHAAANMWAPVTFDAEGRLIDVGQGVASGGETSLVRLHTRGDGSVDSTVTVPSPPPEEIGLHTVTRRTGEGAITFYLYQPHGPSHLVAHGPGGRWAEAVSSDYRIEVHGPRGRVVTIEGPAGPGPELTEAERQEAGKRMEDDRERLDLRPGALPYGVPDRKPPLRDLQFDQGGRLWVELSVPGDSPYRTADVYDTDGELVGRYRWPAEVRAGSLAWIGRESLLGITVDSLGVQRVARVRFTGGG